MAEQIDMSGHLVLGRWVGGDKPTNESAGTARFEVVEVAKSRDDSFKVGDTIELPQYLAGREEAIFALMGPDLKMTDWHVPCEVTESSWKYIAEMPMPETDPAKQTERLAYFLDYLEHPELVVSNDAYGEFAIAEYAVIKPLRERIPRDKVRQWFASPKTAVTRIGLYGVLLGLCGDDSDVARMEQKILVPDSDFRLGLDGIMFGYLILSGESGLSVLEKSKMQSHTYVDHQGAEQKLPFSETYASVQALRHMWTYEPDLIPKARLKQSLRLLVDRSELADLVIADLARWKDWEIMDQLMTIYVAGLPEDVPQVTGAENPVTDPETEERNAAIRAKWMKQFQGDAEAASDFDVPSIRRAIVRYLLACAKDFDKEVTPLPKHVDKANECLAELESLDPKTVRNARRFLRF
jgi:hypothetical protein